MNALAACDDCPEHINECIVSALFNRDRLRLHLNDRNRLLVDPAFVDFTSRREPANSLAAMRRSSSSSLMSSWTMTPSPVQMRLSDRSNRLPRRPPESLLQVRHQRVGLALVGRGRQLGCGLVDVTHPIPVESCAELLGCNKGVHGASPDAGAFSVSCDSASRSSGRTQDHGRSQFQFPHVRLGGLIQYLPVLDDDVLFEERCADLCSLPTFSLKQPTRSTAFLAALEKADRSAALEPSLCGVPHLQIVSVDTHRSILFGHPVGKRILRGLGNSVLPVNVRHNLG